jgi:hypothetical protein
MPNLVTTAATTVGALNSGSITSGFGTIDTGSSTITTTGLITGGSLDIDDVVINGSTIGHTDDTDLITVASGIATVAGELSVTTLDIGGTNVTSTAAELNILDGVTATTAELNIMDGVTSTAAQSNITSLGTLTTLTVDNVIINGSTIGHTGDTDLITVSSGIATVAGEVSMTTLDIGGTNVTSTAAELNALDGITAVVGELNALDIGSTAIGTAVASKAVILDANKDYTGIRNLTISGDLTVSGDDITMGTNTAGNILVADGTNFNSIAVGGLSEISTVANDDVFLAVDTSGGGLKRISRSAVVSGLATSSAISNVVEDTSPQLGGNLDMNGADIVTTSNADLELAPNGTGHVTVRGNTNQGTIQFNCESNSHGQKIKAAPHSESADNVLTLPSTGGDSRLVSAASTATLTNKTLTSPKINEDVAVTSTATELNVLDGITAVVGELNALDLGATAVGTAIASKAVILDSNKDYTGFRNITLSGELDAGSLDVSGDADIDGTLEADAITINGTAIASVLSPVAGGSSIVTTGALGSGSIAAGFGAIDNGTSGIRTNTFTAETSFVPDAQDGAALGTTSLQFSDLFLADGAVVGMGDDNEVTLTHVADTGILLNSNNVIQLRDSAINIGSPADGDLDINADDEVEINSTLIDVNGNLDVSGTLAQAGVASFAVAANVAQSALSSSSNAVAWDATAKPNAFHVTTENTTFSAPSNAVEGAFICLEINYNGSHTIAFNTVFEFAASTAPTTTDTDGKTDILVFRYNGAVWQEVGRTLNLSES